jgi:hypothetical protein
MKTLKQFAEQTGYRKVKSPDEQRFVDKHEAEVKQDRAGNKDDVFKATNIKTIDRKKERKGYDTGADEAVYEAVCAYDKNNKMVGRYKDLETAKAMKPGHRYVKEELTEGMSSKDRYAATHASAKGLMKSINDHLNAHKEAANKHKAHYSNAKGPNWGHVGDIENIHSQLKDIHDRLAQSGEYRMNEEAELEEKTLTPAEIKKREEVAKAIKRENPKMPMSKKMAIATATAKKVAEDLDAAISGLSPRLQETMKTAFSKLNEENQQKFATACATEEGLDKMVAFAIENRGE